MLGDDQEIEGKDVQPKKNEQVEKMSQEVENINVNHDNQDTVIQNEDPTLTKEELETSCFEMLEVSRVNVENQLTSNQSNLLVVQLCDIRKMIAL